MSNEAWAILCDARSGGSYGIDAVAMVDRTKSQSTWWTSDDESILMVFRTLQVAESAKGRIRFNNPRIVTADFARRALRRQRELIAEEEIARAVTGNHYEGDF